MPLPRFLSLHVLLPALLITVGACAPQGYHNSRLGVLPPQPPTPLWLGSFRAGPADSSLRGAVAVTVSSAPNWSHVLLSMSGARPAASYTWRLHPGACGASGPSIGPDERYEQLIPFADGTAKAEAVIPAVLAPSSAYSVTVTKQPSATTVPAACADLIYGSM